MSKYTRPGQYELVELSILTNSDTPVKLDLSRTFLDCSVYESMIDRFMSGNISIVDTNNIIQRYGLGNSEKVTLEWRTSGVTDTKKVDLVCFEVRGPHSLGNKISGYTLDLCSERLINYKRKRVYNAFNDSTTNVLLNTIKENINLTPSKTTINGVFTGQTILDTIKYFEQLTEAESAFNGYVFYENTNGLNFKPVEELYGNDYVIEYSNRPYGTLEDPRSSFEETFNVIQGIQQLPKTNYLEQINDGVLGVKNNSFSLSTKELTTVEHNIVNVSNNSLGRYKLLNENILGTEDSKKISYTLSKNPTFNKTKNQIIKYSLSYIPVEIQVFGNSAISIGDVCKASIPSYSSSDFSEKDFDVYSGNFLMTEIKHTLSPTHYEQRIKLMKDSTEEAL